MDRMLLRIFEAVMSERNVTRAAERLNLHQSTVSKGLSQLRERFGDALFLRNGRGVVPTHRALELAEPVHRALSALDDLLVPASTFQASRADTRFAVAANDYVCAILLPDLLARLALEAPAVEIHVQSVGDAVPDELLTSGRVDLVLSGFGNISYPLHRQRIFSDHYVCVARAGHPAFANGFSLDAFVAARHLAIPRQTGAREMVLQDAMQRLGVERHVAVQVPHMLAVPTVLAATDLIATIGLRMAGFFRRHHDLAMAPLPVPVDEFGVYALWHNRTHASPSHQWLRQVIAGLSS